MGDVKAEVAELRGKLAHFATKTEIAEVRSELKTEIAQRTCEFRTEIAGLRPQLLKWMFIGLLMQSVVLLAVLGLFLAV
jgi:hypothetical protein